MIPTEDTHLKVSVTSHAGAGSEHNEDRYAVQGYRLNDAAGTPSLFAMVADGVGKLRAGETAAELAVETISRVVGQSDASQPTALLQAAIIQAGQTILAHSEAREESRGMGSTCLCAWVVGQRLYTASVGNSRLFLLRGRRLQPLNIAHELADDELTVDGKKAKSGESRGYVGSRTRLQIDLRLVLRAGGEKNAERNQGAKLEANDRLLLCTDGLSDALSEAEIAEVLGSTKIEAAGEALVAAALKKGAPGDLTALVLGVPPARTTPTAQRMRLRKLAVMSVASLLMVLVSLLGWFFWGGLLNPNVTPRPTAIATLTAGPPATKAPTLPAE